MRLRNWNGCKGAGTGNRFRRRSASIYPGELEICETKPTSPLVRTKGRLGFRSVPAFREVRLPTLAVIRVGGFEVNPLVASLTIHFGRVGGVVLSKVIAVLLMLGVRRRLWMVNLVYIGVICWNVIVVVSLVLRGS